MPKTGDLPAAAPVAAGRRALLAVAALLAAAPAARSGPADLKLLESEGIEATPDSLQAFFLRLYPRGERAAEAQAQAGRLASGDPAVRDAAAQRLADMGAAAIDALQGETASPDPEVRRTARELFERALRTTPRSLLLAALRTVTDERVPGLAADILALLPLCDHLAFQAEAEAALRATVGRDDLLLLRATLAGDDARARPVAVLALGSVLEEAELGELRALLRGTPDAVRIAAAWALADRGDRTALPVFGELLDSEDPWTRARAARALRHVSGLTFGYTPSADPRHRRKAAAAWRRWIEEHGATAAWTPPLAPPPRDRGRTLVAIYNEDRVIELDAEGRLVWEIDGLPKPWAIQGLPNGNRLIVHHPGKTLVEYDAAGKEVWRKERLPGFVGGVCRLENGNTLVAVTNPDQILELRPDDEVEWHLAIEGRPTDARPLENGNLLVTLGAPGRVVELDRKTGKEVWAIQGLSTPYMARRLGDGNTLVAEYGPGRVVEFDTRGKAVWEYGGLKQCYSAERLPDGSTLVADRDGVREVDRSGRVRWLYRNKSGKGFLRATRY